MCFVMTPEPPADGRKTREPYRDLASDLREQIATGQLPPGARLPSSRELAAQHNVALTTAVRAVAMLREENLVTTTHGRGSYVSARHEIVRGDARRARLHPEGLSANRDEADNGGYVDEVDRADRGTAEATPALAERLGVMVGAPLSVVRYRWMVGGLPTQISTQWEPLDITRGTSAELPASAERGQPSGIARYARIGWHVSHVIEEYRTRLPFREEASLLEIPDGAPVLTITRQTFAKATDGTERVIEIADITARGDRMVIRSEHELSWSQ
jgi:GntR family transcriptional regulator